MSEQKQIKKCNNCHSELSGEFCSNCGHPQKLKKINSQYLLSEIGSILNFDKGIFFTVRELLVRPGLSIQKFISEDRNRLVKPIVFIIVCSLVYTTFQKWLDFEDGYIGFSDWDDDSTVTSIFAWISKNYGYVNILMAVFIAFWIKILFRKYDYNFFEVLVLLSFVIGIEMLIFAFLGTLDSFTGFKVLEIGSTIGFIYVSWGIGQFFDKRKKVNYLKALFSYILGMLSFMIVAIGIGLFIDWLNR